MNDEKLTKQEFETRLEREFVKPLEHSSDNGVATRVQRKLRKVGYIRAVLLIVSGALGATVTILAIWPMLSPRLGESGADMPLEITPIDQGVTWLPTVVLCAAFTVIAITFLIARDR